MNDRTRKISILCLLFACLLVGCSIESASVPTPLSTTTLPPRPSPTSPVVDIAPIPSIVTLDVQKQKNLVFSPCLAVSPEPLGGKQIPWLLLMQRAAVYTIAPNTGLKSDELIPPPSPTSASVYDFALSPDGKWIAYVLSGENDDLVVEPSNNLLTKSSQGRIIWRPENLFQLNGWLSNESVALRIYRSPDRFASTLIRNPFNEKEHEFFLEELPDYLYYQPGGLPGAMLFAHSNLMPDPTLKRLVYPTIHGNDYYRATL